MRTGAAGGEDCETCQSKAAIPIVFPAPVFPTVSMEQGGNRPPARPVAAAARSALAAPAERQTAAGKDIFRQKTALSMPPRVCLCDKHRGYISRRVERISQTRPRGYIPGRSVPGGGGSCAGIEGRRGTLPLFQRLSRRAASIRAAPPASWMIPPESCGR